MIRSAVTISLIRESQGGPWVFWHDLPAACRAAQDLGFDAIEIYPPSADTVDPALLRKLLDDHGLSLAAVGTSGGWVRHKLNFCLPDAAARAKAAAFIRSIIDFAGPFGASAGIGSMQGRSSDEVDAATARGYQADAFESLGEYALQYRTPLIIEPLNRYETNILNTLDAGVALLKSLSTKNVRLIADLFHMNIEEADSAAAIRRAAGFIGHLHFVDSNRRAAGFGHIDFGPIASALKDISFDGYASAEALALPDSMAAARKTIETFKTYFPRAT